MFGVKYAIINWKPSQCPARVGKAPKSATGDHKKRMLPEAPRNWAGEGTREENGRGRAGREGEEERKGRAAGQPRGCGRNCPHPRGEGGPAAGGRAAAGGQAKRRTGGRAKRGESGPENCHATSLRAPRGGKGRLHSNSEQRAGHQRAGRRAGQGISSELMVE
jgi:hypothetical protein